MESNVANTEDNLDNNNSQKEGKEPKKSGSKQLKRNFIASDAEFLMNCDVFNGMLETDLLDFNGFDTDFNANYIATFNSEIMNAYSHGTDELLTDKQRQLTDVVTDLLKQCTTKYAELRYFVGRAFAKELNKVYLHEFGSSRLAKVRAKPADMVVFMYNLYIKTNKYKTELLAKGYTQAKIDELLTLRNNLLEAAALQDGFIDTRPLITHLRILALNNLNLKMSRISAAAEIIYFDNPAKRGMYIVNK